MELTSQVAVVRGEEELFARTAHLFAAATEVCCAANDLNTWVRTRAAGSTTAPAPLPARTSGRRVRKIYRPGVLLSPASTRHLTEVSAAGAEVRITSGEINETIILDRRVVILAGDTAAGTRSYSVIPLPEVVQGVLSLFEAAWRGATDLAVYDAQTAELRQLAPRVLELLASGCKDETAARALGLGVRTYRRRVAELLAALGADSRFQAGVRARELGLV
ncbi:helix-turn-helix domain-containing protein [Actinophytocola xanthii]|uniref:LuxR family transcriptional regulator n=1 Tax=Actinophytocola xanthii TaxID=1912961 RepID=A0A1Q8CN27_9PSEU|nr:response regulator transcription factor [Actinophytocola xanthii]OLF15757.1 LuxR family transcriptional regulator [Actinophytocola xanthii]